MITIDPPLLVIEPAHFLLEARGRGGGGGGGALGHFLGVYVPPGTPNWHPVLNTISPKFDTPF